MPCRRVCLLLGLTAGCTGPLEVGPEIVGIGVVTGMPNDFMMPTIAENRALDALRRQFEPRAVQFTFESAEGFTILETKLPTAPFVSGGARLIPVRGGWMARARAGRHPEVVTVMRMLPMRRVSSEVRHSSLGTALRLAESRAMRAAIADAALASGGGAGRYTGSMTIGAMRVNVVDRSVEVEMLVHIDIEEHKPITDAERKRILTAVAQERRKLGEVDAALDPIDKALEIFPDDAPLYALRGELLLARGDRDEAAEAFGRAAELAPGSGTYTAREALARGEAAGREACRLHEGGGSLICGARVCMAQDECQVAFFSIAAGGDLTCGITLEGAAVCWGDGGDHELVDTPAETFTRVSLSWDHGCGIEPDGDVECWGSDDADQSSPPDGRFVQISAGTGDFTCGITSEQVAVCWGRDDLGEATAPEGRFKQVTAGLAHACALTTAGAIRCWGDDTHGQLAAPAGTFSQLDAGDLHTCAVRDDGAALCWGEPSEGRLDAASGEMVRVAVGSGHACGLVADGSVLCWGRGVDSELCDDEARQCGQAAPPQVTLTQITAGADHTCGIRADGFTVCWGRDQAGQATPPTELPE